MGSITKPARDREPDAPENDDEQFNPNGLRMTARIPVALFSYAGLSPGSKLLYARLALFRGLKASGFCAPGLPTLSDEMAVSIDTIERWMQELVTERFIARKRRRRAAAECVFLPHPCFFDSASVPAKETPRDSAKIPLQSKTQDSANLPNHEARQDSAESPNQRPALDSATTRLRFRKFALLDSANLTLPYKEENLSSSKPFIKTTEFALECGLDDDKNHSLPVKPEAELRQIFRTKTGLEISRDVEQRIWETCELRGVTRIEFIEELRPHLPNAWTNPAGFLTDFARRIHSKKAGMQAQVPRLGPVDETGRCSVCHGTGYIRYDKDPAAREYCDCQLGQELKRTDARLAAEAAIAAQIGNDDRTVQA